jgi:hypothetical protein
MTFAAPSGRQQWLDRFSEFLQIEVMLDFVFQPRIFGTLFFAWDVIFSCAGLSATSLCGSHLDTLAHRGLLGYLLTA